MKALWRLLSIIALTHGIAIASETPGAADVAPLVAAESSRLLTINPLQRKSRASGTVGSAVRDPFMIANQPAAATTEPPAITSLPPAPATTASFSTFILLGKQQDDEGWSVFIGAPGQSGQVWVVREGETFDENYRVSKLAPPVLVIKDNRSRKSKTFDIGKDEE